MSSYPLDLPGASLVSRIAAQPYPAYPQGWLVPRGLFNASMSGWAPLGAAALYLLCSKTANARLARRQRAHAAGKAPPPTDYVKNSQILSALVLAHNAGLAIFSAWAFIGTFVRAVPYLAGGARSGGLQGLGAAYCTVPTHDPAGMGGILWWFYMSKYYEIVDSIILVLKGKKVSNLQSYHHAGAIAAMWAGVRYSASAIFIFSMFNGFIHTLMYSYYTLSTLRLPFARTLRRTMTTLQVAQLCVGGSIAALYLVLRYSPAALPSDALPSIGDLEAAFSKSTAVYASLREALLNDAAALGDTVNPFTAGVRDYILSLASSSQAASKAAAASSTLSAAASRASPASSALVAAPSTTATLLREGLLYAANADAAGTVSCCASSGQAFAVAINVIYLIPLITLFVRFYLRSYIRGAEAKGKKAE